MITAAPAGEGAAGVRARSQHDVGFFVELRFAERPAADRGGQAVDGARAGELDAEQLGVKRCRRAEDVEGGGFEVAAGHVEVAFEDRQPARFAGHQERAKAVGEGARHRAAVEAFGAELADYRFGAEFEVGLEVLGDVEVTV